MRWLRSWGDLVQRVVLRLNTDPAIAARVKEDRGFRALHTQTLNHLRHVSFIYRRESPVYTHADVLMGAYPVRPTLEALRKAKEFLQFATHGISALPERLPPSADREKALLQAERSWIKTIISESLPRYQELKARLKQHGLGASFPEFAPMVEYLDLKLRSNEDLMRYSLENSYLGNYLMAVLRQLERQKEEGYPYLATIDAVERVLEFYDVYYRAIDPERSPQLYHSGRYEYYLHYLKAQAPDHILIQTLASLGATDLLKTRGVPISFAGVVTEISYVDGYFQTPFEFYIHDINHSRRMFLFFKELADERGLSIDELARISDDYVKEKLIPLITILPTDDDATKNRKRLMKILLFEVLHEDALPALKEVLEKAVLREPDILTPFERIDDDNKVVYVMEPGATTLAYVLRKLAHDFYDMPEDRFNNIVAPEYRTRDHIVSAAESLFEALGIAKVERSRLQRLVDTDQGLPEAYRGTIESDNLNRPGETEPLLDTDRVLKLAKEQLLQSDSFPYKLDQSREIVIRTFFRRRDRVEAYLSVPVQGQQNPIDCLVAVPQELVGINRSAGTMRQLRGAYRVIRIHSGPHLKLAELKNYLLSKLPTGEYLIAVRADDPQAGEILSACREYGLTTVMVVSARNPMHATSTNPTFFTVAKSNEELELSWTALAAPAPGSTSKHVALDFQKPLPQPLRALWRDLEHARRTIRHELELALIDRGVSVVTFDSLATTVSRNRVPVVILGASLMSWPNVSPAQQENTRQTLAGLFDAMDPQRATQFNGGMNVGVEGIAQHESTQRGVTTVGAVAETADPSEIGPLTHATVMGNDWSGRSKPLFEFVQKNKGIIIFVAGGETLKEEIELAEKMGLSYYVMEGPEGAADDFAKSHPERAFLDSRELMGKLFRDDHRRVLRDEYWRPARDALVENFKKEVEKKGITKVVSFETLVEKAQGKKVVIIGGYMGLGYQRPDALKAAIRDLVRENGDNTFYVCGATAVGIGNIYHWIPEFAKEFGLTEVKTAGIVSSNIAALEVARQDYLVLVDTEVENWEARQGRALWMWPSRDEHKDATFSIRAEGSPKKRSPRQWPFSFPLISITARPSPLTPLWSPAA